MAPSDQPQPALGRAIRELREKQDLTQEAAAHDAGITTATLGVIERGLSNPTWATLRGITSALETSMVESPDSPKSTSSLSLLLKMRHGCDTDCPERSGTSRTPAERVFGSKPKTWLCTGPPRHHPEL